MGSGSGDIGKALGGITDAVGLTNYSGEEALAAQQAAANSANALQLRMYNQNREDNAPWRDQGVKSLGELAGGKFMDNWQQDPGFQFRLAEGNKAINNASAARGNAMGGATMKALTEYGQNLASNEYNNVYNRQYNRLSSLAGFGQNANNQNQAGATNYANQVGQNTIGMGNAAAANGMAQSNRMGSLISAGIRAAGAYYGAGAGK